MLPEKVVLASGNSGKLRELLAMLGPLGIEVISQNEFGVPDVAETGLSFVENAIIKARHASRHTGLPAVADDSGIEVDVLGGAPGIYSARYAREGASDEENLRFLLERVADTGISNPAARFQCLIVLLRSPVDSTPMIAQGTWHGHIVPEPRGTNGFGYDPIFYVPSHQCTSAELDPATKNQISHRGQAMNSLMEKLGLLST